MSHTRRLVHGERRKRHGWAGTASPAHIESLTKQRGARFGQPRGVALARRGHSARRRHAAATPNRSIDSCAPVGRLTRIRTRSCSPELAVEERGLHALTTVEPFCEIDSFSDPGVAETVASDAEVTVIEKSPLTPPREAESANVATSVADGVLSERGEPSIANTQTSSVANRFWIPRRLAAPLCIVAVVAISLGKAIRDGVGAPEPAPRRPHTERDRRHHRRTRGRRGRPPAIAIAPGVPPRVYDPERPAPSANAGAPAPANGPSAVRKRPARPSNVGSRGQFAYLGD